MIIAAFLLTDEPVSPKMLLVDSANRFSGWLADNSRVVAYQREEQLA